jgi:hypothetical protein
MLFIDASATVSLSPSTFDGISAALILRGVLANRVLKKLYISTRSLPMSWSEFADVLLSTFAFTLSLHEIDSLSSFDTKGLLFHIHYS